MREEIGSPMADGFPGLAHPSPTSSLELLDAQLISLKVSKWIELTPRNSLLQYTYPLLGSEQKESSVSLCEIPQNFTYRCSKLHCFQK